MVSLEPELKSGSPRLRNLRVLRVLRVKECRTVILIRRHSLTRRRGSAELAEEMLAANGGPCRFRI